MLARRMRAGEKRIACLIAIGATLVVVPSAAAATITVTSTADKVTNNDGICSLREAISEANEDMTTTSPDCTFTGTLGDDTINIGPGTFPITINPPAPPSSPDNLDGDFDLDLNDGDLTIDGAGPNATTIDGENRDRVFHNVGLVGDIESQLTISDLTVTRGKTHASNDSGGGLTNDGSGAQNTTIENSRFTSNQANGTTTFGGGGAISFYGDFNQATRLDITDSTFSDNSTGAMTNPAGGAIWIGGQDPLTVNITRSVVDQNRALSTSSTGSGGIALSGTGADVTISDTDVTRNENNGTEGGGISLFFGNAWNVKVQDGSRITDNLVHDLAAPPEGADGRGGGIFALPTGSSTLTVSDSEVSGNDVAQGTGGGISFDTSVASNKLVLDRATIADNSAGQVGGVRAGGVVEVLNTTISGNTSDIDAGGLTLLFNSSILELRHSTIADNVSTTGPDAFNAIPTSFPEAWGSVLADSAADGVPDDTCGGAQLIDQGGNLDDGTSCDLVLPSSLPETDPLLGPLAANGGPVRTHALTANSPAVNLVLPGDCNDLLNGFLAVDARGFGRPFPSGGICDAGAYERRDSDGDGFADESDNCVAVPGTAAGCPPVVQSTPPPGTTTPKKKCRKGFKLKKGKCKRKKRKKKK
jgi:CSLREA domain-containing protein